MLKKSPHIELTRRVTGYHAMFILLAVAWLILGSFYVFGSIRDARSESTCLIQLGRATATLGIEYIRGGPQSLQPFAEHVRAKGALAYCAVVNDESKIIAHSSRDLVGKVWTEPTASIDAWDDVRRFRFKDEAAGYICDYSTSLRNGDDVVGTVHIAVAEPSFSSMATPAAAYAHLLLLGPLLLLVGGSHVLRGIVNPLNDIEKQLRQVARLPSAMSPQLQPVEMEGLAQLGWNRLAATLSPAKTHPNAPRADRPTEVWQQPQQLDVVLQSLPEGLAITNLEGVITFANPAMAALLRAGETSSLLGETMEASLCAHWPLVADHPLLDRDARNRTIVSEIKNPRDDESSVLRVTRNPIRGNRAGFVWTVRDVTQQKLAEQSRSQFVDTATHELRTPLANIKAYAETLALAEITDPEQQKQFLNTINSEATRLARFVDDLLCVSSMEVGTLTINQQETDLARVLCEVIDKVRPQLEQKQIALDLSLPQKLEKAFIDKEKIAAALINLLGNAVKYTPEHGRITFRVAAEENQLRISIEDSGVGIAEEELPHVFDKFFRSSDPRVQAETGTGLGLSLSREIVRLHGGEMQIRSEINKGTKVTVQLPLA